tara:strand:- start:384 stop:1109 length:726 start_codon:yes stop_codon:yes gene_type:complete
MNNQFLGDTRDVSNTLFGSQGVIDTQEQYKRSIKDKAYDNESFKFLGTGSTGGTQTQLQITRTDLNDNNGNAGKFDRDNRQTLFCIFRRLRHTTSTTVNLVLSCSNAANTAINDTDNHYSYARIEFRAPNSSGYRLSGDASRYYANFSQTVFSSSNANHTGAGCWDISQLGEQHRNLDVHGQFVYYGTNFVQTLGMFNFDHVDDNADDLPAYFNFAAYTGNNAHKFADHYGYPEPHAIIMD